MQNRGDLIVLKINYACQLRCGFVSGMLILAGLIYGQGFFEQTLLPVLTDPGADVVPPHLINFIGIDLLKNS
jgi:hypothetical protein